MLPSGSIFQLKIPKCVFGRGFTPDTTIRAYSAPPDCIVGFQGTALWQGRGEKERGMGEERKGRRAERFHTSFFFTV